MKTYINSFYRPEHVNNPYIHKEITATINPELYNGYELHKHNKNEVHIVKDNVCVGMVGTIEFAKQRIDTNTPSMKGVEPCK